MTYDITDLFGKRYLRLMDIEGKLYIQKIDDKGQKWELQDDKGTNHWRDCQSVEPSDPPAINQFRRSDLRVIGTLWRRSHLARSQFDGIC